MASTQTINPKMTTISDTIKMEFAKEVIDSIVETKHIKLGKSNSKESIETKHIKSEIANAKDQIAEENIDREFVKKSGKLKDLKRKPVLETDSMILALTPKNR